MKSIPVGGAPDGENEPTVANAAVIYRAPIRVGAVNAIFSPPTATVPEPPDMPTSAHPATAPQPTEMAARSATPHHVANPPRAGLGGRGCVLAFVLLALGIVLGAGLALAVLFVLNGTLDFGRHERLIYLNSWVTDLDRRIETVQGRIETQDTALKTTQTELETLRRRLDESSARLETLNTGLSDLTDRADALARELEETSVRMADFEATVETVTQENAAIRSQFEDINNRLVALNESAARFRDFLLGLQTLLDDLVAVTPATAPEAETAMTAAPEEAITGSPALSLFPPLTPIPPPAAGQSHIFGLVWRDANSNGLPEEGEAVVVGAVVVLAQADGRRLAATVTGADGRYLFADLVPGAYVVTLPSETTPAVSLVAGADEAVEVNIGLTP